MEIKRVRKNRCYGRSDLWADEVKNKTGAEYAVSNNARNVTQIPLLIKGVFAVSTATVALISRSVVPYHCDEASACEIPQIHLVGATVLITRYHLAICFLYSHYLFGFVASHLRRVPTTSARA